LWQGTYDSRVVKRRKKGLKERKEERDVMINLNKRWTGGTQKKK